MTTDSYREEDLCFSSDPRASEIYNTEHVTVYISIFVIGVPVYAAESVGFTFHRTGSGNHLAGHDVKSIIDHEPTTDPGLERCFVVSGILW